MMVYVLCRKFVGPPARFSIIAVFDDGDRAHEACEKKKENDSAYAYHFIVAKRLKENDDNY